MEKTYKVRIGFGDGKPIEVELTSKTGALACEKASKEYPCAKSVHLLGIVGDEPIVEDYQIPIQRPDLVVSEDKPHPLFG